VADRAPVPFRRNPPIVDLMWVFMAFALRKHINSLQLCQPKDACLAFAKVILLNG
jgi:hypothetical protein